MSNDRNADSPKPNRAVGRRRWVARLGLILILAGSMTYVFRNPWLRGNVGVVDGAKVYRSAQPVRDWAGLVNERKLATVLNLRGGSGADPWYALEVRETGRLGVDFYDLPLSATARPTRKQLLTVLDVLDRCRYPLLIHCKSGSDRTGLVSGLYLMARKGVAPEVAEGALSLYYGHVPILGTRRMHEPFQEYASWLKAHALPHTPRRFRDWVAHEYHAADPLVELDPLPIGPRDRRQVRASGDGDSATR